MYWGNWVFKSNWNCCVQSCIHCTTTICKREGMTCVEFWRVVVTLVGLDLFLSSRSQCFSPYYKDVPMESHPSKLVGSTGSRNRYFDFDKLAEVRLTNILFFSMCIVPKWHCHWIQLVMIVFLSFWLMTDYCSGHNQPEQSDWC